MMFRRAFLKRFSTAMSAVAVAPFVPLVERAAPFVPFGQKPPLLPIEGTPAFTLGPNTPVYGFGLVGKDDNFISVQHFSPAKTLCEGDTLQVTYRCVMIDD